MDLAHFSSQDPQSVAGLHVSVFGVVGVRVHDHGISFSRRQEEVLLDPVLASV
jgi:hypothetical protein